MSATIKSFSRSLGILGAAVLGIGFLVGAAAQKKALPASTPPQSFDGVVSKNAQKMMEQGRQIFRYDTFGSEAFWGDALQLHKAIAGAKNGGVGAGVSPKTALSVGLKVDADALPAPLVQQIKAGKVDLDDPATTLALLKLNAVVGVNGHFEPGRQHPLDGHPVRVLPLDRRRLVRSRHRKAPRRMGEPRPERRRDRLARAEPEAVHRPPRRRRSHGEEGARELGPGAVRRGARQGRQGAPAGRQAGGHAHSRRPSASPE